MVYDDAEKEVSTMTKKHLFLSGPAGTSDLLCRALGDALAGAGGFVSRVERDGQGSILRASLLPAAAAGGVEGLAPLPYLDLSRDSPRHNNELLRSEGVRLLQEAAWYPFAVLDGIGSFELLLPQFRDALAELLNADLPILGSLLQVKEAVSVCRRLGLTERAEMNIARLWEALRADPDTQILETGGLGRLRAERALAQWVREQLR